MNFHELYLIYHAKKTLPNVSFGGTQSSISVGEDLRNFSETSYTSKRFWFRIFGNHHYPQPCFVEKKMAWKELSKR